MNKEDTRDLRHAFGSFPTGVTVVTSKDKDDNPIGFTANSFTSVSLNPQLILICIDKASFNIQSFSAGEHFAVSVLSENQHHISTIFASPEMDRFNNIRWESKITGSPIIADSVAWFDCDKDQFIDAGDHFILIGKVRGFDSNSQKPLVYLRGNYVNLGLEQKMLLAMENKSTKILVGALIEWRKKIFLLEDKTTGLLYFPTATRLGVINDDQSLLGKLHDLKISVSEHYLFSVFENSNDKTSLIYYRTKVEDGSSVSVGQFYEFDTIPFDLLIDDASRIMLKRYIAERELNAFGIFVGKESEGKVEAITKPNDIV
ncbi:MAG TPA: flavin reductase [Candidatus Thioglobus sp.]|jgi:flavin reductase (DIM6/NTAB) family NADH-FMN oxidoreductase RutF|nr:flavin reductase [Candidatus Thioglobus sp.]